MDSTEIEPPRDVGPWGTMLFPLNGMIGAGIFALPAVLVAAVGSFAPWMMLIGGILFLPLTLVYALLASRFEHSGGPVLYGEAAFGRFIGFQAGWGKYASAILTFAANTHVMIAYFAAIFPWLGQEGVAGWATTLMIVATVVINVLGMRGTVGTLGLLTAVKLVPLAILVMAAIFAETQPIGFSLPQFSDTESVILLTFYAFIGFENLVDASGELRNPKRDAPRAMVAMVATVTLIYMAVIWAYLAIAPGTGNEDNALAAAGRAAMGDFGALIIVLAAGASIGANNFASGTTGPRLSYGMAQRGMLPRWFLSIHPRWKTPANAITFYGVGAVLFGLWEGFAVLAVAGTLVRLVAYTVSSAALPVLEKRECKLNALHLALSAFAICCTLWVASHADSKSLLAFAGLMVLGTILYFIAARETPIEPDPS